ncbi:MAG: DUF1116 domain-containing protein [Thermoleophilia bacterium]
MDADRLRDVEVVNLGLESFADAVRAQGAPVAHVDWRPAGEGDPRTVALLTRLWGAHGDRVDAANRTAVGRMEAARPLVTGVSAARDAVPWLAEGRRLLHSGPPIEWARVCDPQRRAMVAAVVFEGWAQDREAAAALLAAGDVALASGNEHGHVGPMTGVCSPSMRVWVAHDEATGVRACATLNEGPGDTLWFGVGGDAAIARLRFFRDTAGPLLDRLLQRCGPVDVFALTAQGLNMGDELHMRSQATGNLLIRHLLPGFAALGGEDVAAFLVANHHFFLTLTMAAAKCASLAAQDVPGSSVVTLIARNGTDVGVQLAGLPGRWFTAPAARVQDALLREGNTPDDAALDIGDSAVIECIGLGGMAVAAAPTVASFLGGSAAETVARVGQMAEICVRRSQRFTLAALDGAGTPVGIDARMVVDLGVTPQITTGVLHNSSGAGQIGAGIAHQPLAPFREALAALVADLDR